MLNHSLTAKSSSRAGIVWWLFLSFGLAACQAPAQTNPITYSAIYGYAVTNDVPNQPLVTLSVLSASNVACLTVEQILPSPTTPLSVSGDGVYLPALHAIRWGPYFNLNNTNALAFSYRLTGLPGQYPVDGGVWLDGQTYVSAGIVTVTVLPRAGVPAIPSAPPQVVPPVFTPPSGTGVPVSITITDATPGAVVYYTTNGALPTQTSTLYTGPLLVAAPMTFRAAAFTNGWTPSVAAEAYYSAPAATSAVVNAQVTLGVNSSSPAAPVVSFSLVPGTTAGCETFTATLPPGVSALAISAAGQFVAANNCVVWGPFLGTNAQTLSFQAASVIPGVYPITAAWSVDGFSSNGLVSCSIMPASGVLIPTPPSPVAPPVFTPASGTGVPVSIAITDATPGALIYYTTNGATPTQSSTLYTGPLLVGAPTTLRAAAFTNGWAASVAALAYYGAATGAVINAQVTLNVNSNAPTAPVVSFNLVPGANAGCAAVTASLPPGTSALNISAGGQFVATNNSIVWGPFFGTNPVTLSFQAESAWPGVYPIPAAWSVDGVSASGLVSCAIAPASGIWIPTAPTLVPTPVLSPVTASNLPTSVTISCSDPLAQVFYTTNGTLPTQQATPYVGPLTFTTPTTLRATAFHSGYYPSVAVEGQYLPPAPLPPIALGQGVSGNNSFLPTVNLTATPQGTGNCYAVTASLPGGITPYGISGDGVYDSVAGVVRWGPYVDDQPRNLSFNVGGLSGMYQLSSIASCNGYSLPATTTWAQIDTSYTAAPATNLAACTSEAFVYQVNLSPAPGVITVTSATGTVNWGDGTETPITTATTNLQKSYALSGSYTIALSANWSGYSGATELTGQASRSDVVQVVDACGPPQILTQPTNLVVAPGATAQFSVNATSQVFQAYQWYHNQSGALPGANGPTLTLANVGAPVAGSYSVVITSAFGSTTSSVVSLVIFSPNFPPAFPLLPTQVVAELTPLIVTNTATNASVPAFIAGYALLNAPTNMLINSNGIITWTPLQTQSPGTNMIVTVVTNYDPFDSVNPSLTATNTFLVIVREVNVAPRLPILAAQTVLESNLLTVIDTATEPNIHSTLAYQLIGAPAGVNISSNGVITWTPSDAQKSTTNSIIAVVTSSNPYDWVAPQLAATNSFAVVVVPYLRLFNPTWASGGHVQFGLNYTIPGVTYVLESSTNLVDWVPVSESQGVGGPLTISDPETDIRPQRFYRIGYTP